MPGTKKPRKAFTPRDKTKMTGIKHLPMLHLPPAPSFLKNAAIEKKKNLNNIITGHASDEDWSSLMFRLQLGNLTAKQFYKYTDEIVECFSAANDMMWMIKIRYLLTDVWEVMQYERVILVRALDVTEEIMRTLSQSENLEMHKITQKMLLDIVAENQQQDPEYQERQAMLATLQQERLEVEAIEDQTKEAP